MARLCTGILIFDDVEVLDFCGPFEVLSLARLDEARRMQEPSPFEVLLVAETLDEVMARGGMRVLPDVTFEQCPPLDVLVVPGGLGTRREMANEALIGFVKAQASTAQWVASVCTGAFLLAQAGLLEGRKATTHWASLDLFRETFPGIQVLDDTQVVDEGPIMTSAGISAGIDLSLRLVAKAFGGAVARATARRMEYPYPEGVGRRISLGAFDSRRVDFEQMAWEEPMAGVRCKVRQEGDRRLRLVEYRAAMPVHACERGHVGCLLEGEMEIVFEDETLRIRAGDGVFIPDGPAHRHQARVIGDRALALFVESV